MKNYPLYRFFKNWLPAILLSLLLVNGFSEGTRELRPDSSISAAGLYIDAFSYSGYTQFATINCQPNYRLYIHIKNPGEKILFGMQPDAAYCQFNLRKPNGAIAMTGSCPMNAGQTGYIQYFHQAVVGPFPSLGGYNPLTYTVSSIADTGNYYFEISYMIFSPTFPLWDFQVVSGQHDPAIPADTLNGRVYSQSWQFWSELLSPTEVFNARFYVYSDDGIVTRLKFSNARIGAMTIFCNQYGCVNNSDFESDRQSRNNNTFNLFPGVAQYKVFLNNPDSTVYPSGTYGQLTAAPYMIPDTNFPPCTGHQLIVVEVDKPGTVDVTITLPYGGSGSTVSIFSPVVPGINYIPWDGKDANGNYVPDGTLITVEVRFVNGLTNLPIWDQETNPDGFDISLVRPVNPEVLNPETYWDDSQLYATGMCPVSPQTVNLEGCLPGSMLPVPGCHPWGGGMGDCHDKTINTWWYGSSSTAQFTVIFNAAPIQADVENSARCGPGIDTLYASVPTWETVDWYDSLTGGTLLLAGSTSFITPFLTTGTIYFAEARALYSGCLNPVRTPDTARILEVPSPTVTGPDKICVGTSGLIYFTEPGMSGYDWIVSAGGIITAGFGTDSITITWITAGTQSVSVNYTGQNGCPGVIPGIMPVTVIPPPGPASTIRGTDSICIPAQNVIYSVDPVPAAQMYVWTIPPGAVITSGDGTPEITVDFGVDAISGNFVVFAVNPCGAGLPSPPFHVSVQGKPAADAGTGDTICQGQSYTVSGASASGYSALHWIASGTGTLTGETTLAPTYFPEVGETGEVILTLIASGFHPCPDDSSSLLLEINSAPASNAGPDLSTCAAGPVILTGADASFYESLLWTTSGNGTFDDPALLHPQYFPGSMDTLSGSATLLLTASGLEPCPPASDSMVLTFRKKVSVTAGPDIAACGDQNIKLDHASAANYKGILWSSSGDGIFDDPSLLNPFYYPGTADLASGSCMLKINVTAFEPCLPDSDLLVLTIGQPPVVNAGPDVITCVGKPFRVDGATALNFASLSWKHNGAGSIQGGNTLTPVYIPGSGETGNIFLVLTANGTGICSGSIALDSLILAIYPQLNVNAGTDQTVPYGSSAGLDGTAAGGTGNYSYHWEPADLVPDNTNPKAITVSLTQDTVLTLTVTDLTTGCTNSDEILISVGDENPDEDCIVIYNVITPNGDGDNDTWEIDCIEKFPDNNVKIFNRWGDVVNEFENYNNDPVVWKGTNFNGEKLPDGTYYYMVTIKDSPVRAGWVFIRAGSK